jgi:cytochrome P450
MDWPSYNHVVDQMAAGTHTDSFVSRLLSEYPNNAPPPKDKVEIMNCAMSLYVGGADTTTASVRAFFFVCAKFPEVQRRAQEEVDSVVGTDRLPSLSDRPKLPYVQAVIKEVLRWAPVVNIGL